MSVCQKHEWPYGVELEGDARPRCVWCEALRADTLERRLIDLLTAAKEVIGDTELIHTACIQSRQMCRLCNLRLTIKKIEEGIKSLTLTPKPSDGSKTQEAQRATRPGRNRSRSMTAPTPNEISSVMAELGRRGRGKSKSRRVTSEQARRAAVARWSQTPKLACCGGRGKHKSNCIDATGN